MPDGEGGRGEETEAAEEEEAAQLAENHGEGSSTKGGVIEDERVLFPPSLLKIQQHASGGPKNLLLRFCTN